MNGTVRITPVRHVWGPLGAVIGIAGIVIGVVISRSTKEPMYATSGPEMLAKGSLRAPRLRLLWDGQEIPNVVRTKVAIWNQGSKYIDAQDLVKSDPLRIVPSGEVQVLMVEQLGSSRKGLDFGTLVERDDESGREVVQVHVVGDEALEQGDGGLFWIWSAGEEQVQWSVAGRVKGARHGFQKKSWRAVTTPRLPAWMGVLSAANSLLGAAVVAWSLWFWKTRQRKHWWPVLVVLGLVLLAGSAVVLITGYLETGPTWLL